jgi:uncharacterized glyoxalase superfamily protein PhnB
MPPFQPAGYTTASPYLVVNGAAATIEFMQRVLGGELVRSVPMPDGKIGHSEVRLGDSLVMVSDVMEGWPAAEAHVHVYVADVDAAHARALAAGATSVQAPTQKRDDRDKRGGVRDAGGTTWWIATHVG